MLTCRCQYHHNHRSTLKFQSKSQCCESTYKQCCSDVAFLRLVAQPGRRGERGEISPLSEIQGKIFDSNYKVLRRVKSCDDLYMIPDGLVVFLWWSESLKDFFWWFDGDLNDCSDQGSRVDEFQVTPTLGWKCRLLLELRLRSHKSYSILKRPTSGSHFLVFHFDCIQKGDTAIQRPFAITTTAAGMGYC